MKLFLLTIVLITTHCYSQENYLLGQLPTKDGKVTYERIITADSISKASLYQRSKSWALSNFKSQKDALQVDDKDAGVIAYKTFSSYPYQITVNKFLFNEKYNLQYLIKFLLKDGKAKIIIQDIMINSTTTELETPFLPIEQTVYGYEHPNDSLISSLKMSKKQKDMTKATFEKQKAIFISMLQNANSDFLNVMNSIQDHLTGKIKSEMDFWIHNTAANRCICKSMAWPAALVQQ